MDLDRVRALLGSYAGPTLFLDLDHVRAQARRFKLALPDVQPHFAVKANPHPEVLRVLHEEGCRFEIASPSELDLLMTLGVRAKDVLYSNPVKAARHIAYAAAQGVEWFVFDTEEELRKLHRVVPKAKVYCRIDAPSRGSAWPLEGKFGGSTWKSAELVATVKELGSDFAGISFHVGSQCTEPSNWLSALERARTLFDLVEREGIPPLRSVNLGGGFPVNLIGPVPTIETIANTISERATMFGDKVQFVAEPGRFLVANAGVYVCQVMCATKRFDKRWLHLDAGIFNGVFEPFQGIGIPIAVDRNGQTVDWSLAGPTCDSMDVILKHAWLPTDLVEGDFLYFLGGGAYTTAYASRFNGFELPHVVLV